MAQVFPPPPPTWSAEDFARAFQALLPPGPVWPRDADATQTQVMRALVPTYVRNTDDASALIADAFPSTAVDMLPDWEYVLGLPDPCAGPDQTIAQRQAHVVARLTQQNGPSIPSLTAYAAALGFAITIDEFAPARFGQAKFGDPMNGIAWVFAWRVNAPATTLTPARFGSARFGDPFRTWESAVLECEMRRIKPAHTILQFAYSGDAPAALWDSGPGWDHGAWAP